MFKLLSLALLGIVTTLAPARPEGSAASKDIVDTAVAAGSFKTLAAALQAAGLVETLKGKGPFTVFAPTDEALKFDIEITKKLGLAPGVAGKRVVVQGLGNVGYHAAKFLQDAGAILVGISEYEGAIANPDGLDVDVFRDWKAALKR